MKAIHYILYLAPVKVLTSYTKLAEFSISIENKKIYNLRIPDYIRPTILTAQDSGS